MIDLSILNEVQSNEWAEFCASYAYLHTESNQDGKSILTTRERDTLELLGVVVYFTKYAKAYYINNKAVSLTIEQKKQRV